MPPLFADPCSSSWDEQLAHDLLRFFRQRIGCPDTAADLAQEAQLRLWQSLRDTPIDNPRAFGFRIAANMLVDHHRRQAIRDIHTPLEDRHRDTVAGREPTPEYQLEQRQRLQTLQAALAELPEKCRAAFLLNRIEGLSHRDIALRLGVSESMVAKYLAQALRHCRQRL